MSASQSQQQSLMKHTFDTNTQNILQILTEYLYVEKDVFVRELLSNSHDALRKLEVETRTIRNTIQVTINKQKGTIKVKDYGIGMDENDLKDKLGRIAYSDTNVQKQKGVQGLIGQFGIGFYSTFICASDIRVRSRKCVGGNIGKQNDFHQWESQGDNSFVIRHYSGKERTNNNARSTYSTKVRLVLKQKYSEFLEITKLETTIEKYCSLLGQDIIIKVKNTNNSKTQKTIKTLNQQWDEANVRLNINQLVSNIWKNQNEAKVFTWEFQQIEEKSLNKSEGGFKVLLFIGKGKTDYDQELKKLIATKMAQLQNADELLQQTLVQEEVQKLKQRCDDGVKLFVNNVMIQQNFAVTPFFKEYFPFISGYVIADNVELNVTRQCLQDQGFKLGLQNAMIDMILSMLRSVCEDESEKGIKKFEDLYNEHGQRIKDLALSSNKWSEMFCGYLRFLNLKDNKYTTFEQLSKKPRTKGKIYYTHDMDVETAKNSPFVKQLLRDDYDVLFIETIQDYCGILKKGQFKDCKLVECSKDRDLFVLNDFQLRVEKGLLEFLDKKYRISKVVFSKRDQDTPVLMSYADPQVTPPFYKSIMFSRDSDPSLLAHKSEFDKIDLMLEVNVNSVIGMAIIDTIVQGKVDQDFRKGMDSLVCVALIQCGLEFLGLHQKIFPKLTSMIMKYK